MARPTERGRNPAGPGPHHQTTSTPTAVPSAVQHSGITDSGELFLRGQFIAPSGGRYRWWVRVDCVVAGGCGGEHLHADRKRPGERGWLRCCVITGVSYRVHPNPEEARRAA